MEKYIVIFRHNVLKSLLNPIHHNGEIIFNLIMKENNITTSCQIPAKKLDFLIENGHFTIGPPVPWGSWIPQ